jgi:hypothetical protein
MRPALFPKYANSSKHYFDICEKADRKVVSLHTNRDKPPAGYLKLYDHDVDIRAAVEAQIKHQIEFPVPPPERILSAKEELGRIVTMNHALKPKMLKTIFEETGAASIPVVVRGGHGEKPFARVFAKDRTDIPIAGSMSDKSMKQWWDGNRAALKILLEQGPIEIRNEAGERLFFVTEAEYTPMDMSAG